LIKELYGNFGYVVSKRKVLFQHLEQSVVDMESMKDIMRYNGYKNPNTVWNDPSVTSPANGIAARADLEDDKNFSGALDAKITNYQMILNLNNLAISGPTTNKNKNLPIFQWDDKNDLMKDIKHRGVPTKFNFPWLNITPETIKNNNINDKLAPDTIQVSRNTDSIDMDNTYNLTSESSSK